MNNEGNKIKVSGTACLTEQEMMDYIHNRLAPEQRNRIEKHLLECGLCDDAMEGLSLMKSPNMPRDIDKLIDETINSTPVNEMGKTVTFRFNYRMAAAIALLLVGAGVLYFIEFKSTDHEKTITHNLLPSAGTDSAATKRQPDQRESIADHSELHVNTGEKSKSSTQANQQIANNNTASTKVNPAAANVPAKTNSIASNEVARQMPVELEEMAPAGSAIQEEDSTDKTRDVMAENNTSGQLAALKAQALEKRSAKSAARSSSQDNEYIAPRSMQIQTSGSMYNAHTVAAADSSFPDAMNAYDQKDYTEAAKKFDSYVRTHPYNEKATYYDAVSNLKIGNASIALTLLNWVLRNEQSEFYDAAHWYKALALIKLNRLEEGKSLLIEIKDSSSKYANEAAKKLQEL